jgi:alpha-N-arabinofuranosidase
VHIGLTNVDPNRAETVRVRLDGLNVAGVSGRILTAAAMDAHNTFGAPDTVRPTPFVGATINGQTLSVSLPPKSIVMLDLR